MNQAEKAALRQQEYRRRLKEFRLLDDEFMTKCFEDDPKAVELVLRIILEQPDLEVLEVKTQVFVENLRKRSVRLDVRAQDSKGTVYDIEIQRENRGAGFRRARYHCSMMDVGLLEKGADFDQLPETYVIFITEKDVLRRGLPLYRIGRYNYDTQEAVDDGTHIVYVNGAYRGETPLGKLMHDFACPDPEEMHYPVLADKIRFYKETKEGSISMCRSMEELWLQGIQEGKQEGKEEGRQETMIENAINFLKEGTLPLEVIANCIGLPLEEVEKLQATI